MTIRMLVKMIPKLILAFVIFVQIFTRITSNCIWYGECNKDGKNRIQNCPYSGPPKPLENAEAIQILRDFCPKYISDGNNIETCCSNDQLLTFKSKMSLIMSFVGRCPSCFRSFLNIFCDMMCHPMQNHFMEVTSTKLNFNKNVTYISGIRVHVTEEYLNGTFQSCRQIIMPSTGQQVLDLMCGPWGADKCTAKRWFEYMGKVENNEHIPFQTDYITEESTNSRIKPLNPEFYKCNEIAKGSNNPCSCIDCEESCPIFAANDDDIPDNDDQVLQYYMISIFFAVISISVVIYKLLSTMKQKNPAKECSRNRHHSLHSPTLSERPRESTFEKILIHLFMKLGEFCASHHCMLILFGLGTVGILSYGVQYIKLTTDPVELWSSKDSQYRQEREYFNKNFGPFYRAVQVIITTKNVPCVVRNDTNNEVEEFGPAFNKDLLLKFKELQDDILKLGDNETKLVDICFSPLTPDTEKPKSVRKCFTQSVWGYFKNNLRTFNNEIKKPDGSKSDYLSHIKACVQNSYNPLCLAEYGGPVDPAIALGGFSSTDTVLSKKSTYMNATSLVFTIILNNHLNKSELHNTLRWEMMFLNFMKNYTRHKNEMMGVSYFTERFLEDEIDRESNANIKIVMFSYLAMFVYVALLLGGFPSSTTILVSL